MSDAPKVTVLIPARNEEKDIERCLRAVLAQDYPRDCMEIVLVDGGSSDGTVEVASRVLSGGDVAWEIVDNPAGTTPSNLNAGLAVSKGHILCRIDARSLVPTRYVRLCADLLMSRPDVAVTGGAQVAVPVTASAKSAGIARALNNRYAMGGSRYRSGAVSGPTDTVYLGAFRTTDVRSTGGWDEYFETNQDFELNRRLGHSGLVWFDDRIMVGYVPRETLHAIWRQYHRFGRWKVRYWVRTGDTPLPRQRAAFAAAGGSLLASATVVLTGRKKWRRVALVFGLTYSAALAVDDRGSPSGAPLDVRIVAAATSLVVGWAWTAGVARERLRPDGPS